MIVLGQRLSANVYIEMIASLTVTPEVVIRHSIYLTLTDVRTGYRWADSAGPQLGPYEDVRRQREAASTFIKRSHALKRDALREDAHVTLEIDDI